MFGSMTSSVIGGRFQIIVSASMPAYLDIHMEANKSNEPDHEKGQLYQVRAHQASNSSMPTPSPPSALTCHRQP